MRDVYEVLREKEIALTRLRQEVAALRFAASLLADDDSPRALTAQRDLENVDEHVDEDNLRSKRHGRSGGTAVPDERGHWGTEVANGAVVGAARKISNRLKRMATLLSSTNRSVAQSS
jgi:hypothetical protein